MTAVLRQAVLGRLAGYEDTNDADRLRVDPAMRHVVGGRAKEKLGASTSEMGLSRLNTRNFPPLLVFWGRGSEWGYAVR